MQIGPLSQLSRLLAVIVGKPLPTGAAREPMALPETLPPAATGQPHPLASVQMLVTLAALDPQRERRLVKRGPARPQRGPQDVAEVKSIGRYETNKHFVLPVEWIVQGEHADGLASGGNITSGEAHVRVAPSQLDIEV